MKKAGKSLKTSLCGVALIIWTLFSVLYIAYNVWSDDKSIYKSGVETGADSAITQILQRSLSSCEALNVYKELPNGERVEANLVRVDCITAAAGAPEGVAEIEETEQ